MERIEPAGAYARLARQRRAERDLRRRAAELGAPLDAAAWDRATPAERLEALRDALAVLLALAAAKGRL